MYVSRIIILANYYGDFTASYTTALLWSKMQLQLPLREHPEKVHLSINSQLVKIFISVDQKSDLSDYTFIDVNIDQIFARKLICKREIL